MLKLRRGTVIAVDGDRRVVRLTVELPDGTQRPATGYPGMVGQIEPGDRVLVNTEALDLELGSGGFDIVCANLSRLEGGGSEGAHVMKLNYTPLQHAVHPIEQRASDDAPAGAIPVGVIALHGQLAPLAFALGERAPAATFGYIQSAGGALPGALSNVVAELRERELLAGHLTAGAAFGGEQEAITVEGALDAARSVLGWDAAIVGPGPGILGSGSRLGHGGLAALTNVHAALALRYPVVLAPRLSSGDERERHLGLSHHSSTVMELALGPLQVPDPVGASDDSRRQLAAAAGRHRLVPVNLGELLEQYASSGLPQMTMGRSLERDRDFFAGALAAGALLAELLAR
jgi:hypothetical protein